MENFQDEYSLYWETRRFFENEEFDCWGLDEAISGYYDSSSPDGAPSSNNAKNIVSERNRRKKLNERLFALRAVVPKISKMDKASIIKDAIDYIEELHEQESRIQAEIEELESGSKQKQNNNSSDVEYMSSSLSIIKKKRAELIGEHERSTPIEVLELRVSEVGERTSIISITCSKKTDTMVKLCEVFESLKLKIITANITAFSGRLLKTVFVETRVHFTLPPITWQQKSVFLWSYDETKWTPPSPSPSLSLCLEISAKMTYFCFRSLSAFSSVLGPFVINKYYFSRRGDIFLSSPLQYDACRVNVKRQFGIYFLL